ncbi:Inversin [Frankliniella fusca]|uniref:Inversin n=1 Tax=Frankliniella fusca TaxID=407009 RepID=A0AAE1HPX9_9NEOP|nr:Inversin [Frankliniella fusca]
MRRARHGRSRGQEGPGRAGPDSRAVPSKSRPVPSRPAQAPGRASPAGTVRPRARRRRASFRKAAPDPGHAMAVLEKGCFCCELSTCVKVQGFFLAVVFSALAILDVVALAAWVVPREQNPGPGVDEFGRRWISSKYQARVPGPVNRATKVVCAVLLMCLIVWVLLVCLLLYGVYKKRRWMFWPYMVVGGLHLFITVGLLIYYAASVNSKVPNIVILVVILVVQFYLLLNVISLFQKMGEEEDLEPTMSEQQS